MKPFYDYNLLVVHDNRFVLAFVFDTFEEATTFIRSYVKYDTNPLILVDEMGDVIFQLGQVGDVKSLIKYFFKAHDYYIYVTRNEKVIMMTFANDEDEVNELKSILGEFFKDAEIKVVKGVPKTF
ncbi:hypothetical protein [Metallosphaera sp.]|nr:hypothetical protein [Saccharolobus shibatae filamentous virus 3]WHA35194.1 hypothetical protein SSRV2_ORF19 [Saccharolobus shibatae rod virus 2]